MIVLAAQPVPPPAPVADHRVVPAPPQVPEAGRPSAVWAFPGGLSVVSGLANPEWAHVGVAYRYAHLGGGLNLGTQALANNLGAVLRVFGSPLPGGPFVEAGATAVRLIELTPGQTPQDVFYMQYLGAGWQFQASHLLVNLGAGLLARPPRSAAAPLAIVSSSFLPHFLLEAGYVF